jgi:hypothetical protein
MTLTPLYSLPNTASCMVIEDSMMCLGKRGIQGGLVQVYAPRDLIQGVLGWCSDIPNTSREANAYPSPPLRALSGRLLRNGRGHSDRMR